MSEKFGLGWQSEPAPRVAALMAIMAADDAERKKERDKAEGKKNGPVGHLRPRV